MADEAHLRILRQGVEVWNRWREENPKIIPDLAGAYLDGVDLEGANLRAANLSGADLCWAYLRGADLAEANLSGAKLIEADLNGANLMMAILTEANLSKAEMGGALLIRADLKDAILTEAELYAADLTEADLTRADLSGAKMLKASLIETILEMAKITDSRVYGISTWGIRLDGAEQSNLIITNYREPVITVDNLEVAQFIYLLLHSPKIRDVIDTIAKKAVLILGRFSETQKLVLEAIRDELRKHDYLPILFDWDRPVSRNYLETVSTLAHLSSFVIADITDAKSIPAELMSIVPSLPSVAVQPLMLSSDYEYALFDHIMSFKSVLPVYLYDTPEMLFANIKEYVIDTAEAKARELIPPAENR